jgi:hypothetical protein
MAHVNVTHRRRDYSTWGLWLSLVASRERPSPGMKADICQRWLLNLRNFSHIVPLRLILLIFSRNVGGKSKSFPSGTAGNGPADQGAVLFFPWILFLAKKE